MSKTVQHFTVHSNTRDRRFSLCNSSMPHLNHRQCEYIKRYIRIYELEEVDRKRPDSFQSKIHFLCIFTQFHQATISLSSNYRNWHAFASFTWLRSLIRIRTRCTGQKVFPRQGLKKNCDKNGNCSPKSFKFNISIRLSLRKRCALISAKDVPANLR